MFRSVFTKTLRDLRLGILGWGIGVGVLCLATGAAWTKFYPDEASRLRLVEEIKGGLSVAQIFYGEPQRLDTLGGFVGWRVFGIGPVLLGLYAILAATGMTRGAEEGRTIEVVACTVAGRRRLIAQQVLALCAAMVIAAALIGSFVVLTGPVSGEPLVSVSWAAGESLNLAAAALLFGAVGLLASQFFVRRRSAALLATGAMLAAHFLNTVPLVAPDLRLLRYVSPLYLYSRSSPLADGHLDVGSVAGLMGLAGLFFGLGLFLTDRRDLFDVVRQPRWSRRQRRPASERKGPSPSLRLANAFSRGLDDAAGNALAWGLGLGLFSALLTGLTPNVRTAILDQAAGSIGKQLLDSGLTSEKGILSFLVFSVVLPLVTVFAVTVSSNWAGDEASMRLELELSTPVARWATFVQRWLAAATVLAVTSAFVGTAVALTVELGGLDVPLSALVNATWTLAVLTGCVTAVGFAVSSWRPGLTAAVAGAFVAVSYFVNLLFPLFGLPHWTTYISVFGLYGSPLVDGVGFMRVGALAVATALLVVGAAWEFQRRDVVK